MKEFGLLGMDCECLAQDAQRLFDVYWYLSSPGASIPDPWPPQFAAMFNKDSPAKIDIGPNTGLAFWSVSRTKQCLVLYLNTQYYPLCYNTVKDLTFNTKVWRSRNFLNLHDFMLAQPKLCKIEIVVKVAWY